MDQLWIYPYHEIRFYEETSTQHWSADPIFCRPNPNFLYLEWLGIYRLDFSG